MKPFFSVVIPTYNRANELKRAIESVLAQSFTDFEILVMDDGSTDDTASVIASFADQRIIYEWDHNFGGPAKPRNRGIEKAQGDWVCFLDADDWWTFNKLEVCYFQINDAVDFIYHDLGIIMAHPSFFQRKKLKSWQVKKPVFVNLLVNMNPIANSSVVVRKKLLDQIGGINESRAMIASEDYNAWIRIAQITDAFLHIPKCLGYYLDHDKGISKKDTSLSHHCAIVNFVGLVSETQRDSINSTTAYIKGRHHYLKQDYEKAADSLKYCLDNANSRICLRASYMLMLIFFRKILRLKLK